MSLELTPQLAFVDTGVGSLPGTDADDCVRRIVRRFSAMPYWPQLPALGFDESMLWQFLPVLPKRPMQRAWEGRTELSPAQVTAWLRGDLAGVDAPMDRAVGLAALERLLSADSNEEWIKGQVTGPITLALSLRDREGHLLGEIPGVFALLLERVLDAARREVARLRRLRPKILLMVDEPSLFRLVDSKHADWVEGLGSLLAALASEDVATGIHTCGQPPWDLLTSVRPKVINFDAVRYPPCDAPVVRQVNRFLESGGRLAWGIVPTQRLVPSNVLADRARELMSLLNPEALRPSLLTPACGLALLDEAESVAVENRLAVVRAVLAGAARHRR